MSPLDRPVRHGDQLSHRRGNEAPLSGSGTGGLSCYHDRPLAAARGMVNGVLWGAVLWIAICWALF